MTTTGGAKDVGESTTKAVVLCYVMILILNFLLTLSLNLMRSEIIRWFS
jgi:phospholipid/cholesterol/gamma-HCH transport system permease protein